MSDSKRSVIAAILGNTFVMVGKFVASAITGSSTMLAEGFHSLADVLNQVLLLTGIQRSNQEPNSTFRSGFGRERFIWAMISATGIFFLGCGASLWHGISGLLSEHPHELQETHWAFGVLVISLFIEGFVLYIAAKSLLTQAKAEAMPFTLFLKENADPTELAVFLEDGAACLGLLMALGALGLTIYTGNTYWDAIGSIVIGILLGLVAVVLVQKNRTLLIGKSIPDSDLNILRSILKSKTYLGQVQQIRAEVIGSNRFEIQIEVEFKTKRLMSLMKIDLKEEYTKIKTPEDFEIFCQRFSSETVEHVVTMIDELESEITAKIPEVAFIDIEPN